MNTPEIVIAIDQEIERLTIARNLLSELTEGKRRGRPAAAKPAPAEKRKHVLSPEGREKIAAAQKARWAKAKKANK